MPYFLLVLAILFTPHRSRGEPDPPVPAEECARALEHHLVSSDDVTAVARLLHLRLRALEFAFTVPLSNLRSKIQTLLPTKDGRVPLDGPAASLVESFAEKLGISHFFFKDRILAVILSEALRTLSETEAPDRNRLEAYLKKTAAEPTKDDEDDEQLTLHVGSDLLAELRLATGGEDEALNAFVKAALLNAGYDYGLVTVSPGPGSWSPPRFN